MKKNFLVLVIFCLFFSAKAQKTFTIDYASTTGTIKDLVGVNKGPETKVQGYLDAGISMIRTHDFHDAFDYEHYSDFWIITETDTTLNPDFDPTDATYYDWTSTDQQLSVMNNNGFEVFFRLGISYPDNPNYPTPPLQPPYNHDDPSSFDNFAELCKRTAMHTNESWADGLQTNTSYWEIWNEPGGLFWHGSPLEFFQMYATVANAMKNYNPELKIGALGAYPVTSYGINTTFREQFFDYCQTNELPLDFYSWHHYSAKNPYGYKLWGDSIQNIMDSYGFTEAENIISECNYSLEHDELSNLNNSPKGAAYYLSALISAQWSAVDKLFWYVGLGFFDDDQGNTPMYKYSGYALKTFALIRDNTPIALQTTGSEYIETFDNADTTNLMILSAKDNQDEKLYFAISNLNSEYQNFDVQINNLPWTSQDLIVSKKNIVAQGELFTEFTQTLNGNSSLTLHFSQMQSPAVVLVRLEKDNSTHQSSIAKPEFSVFPNPATNFLHVKIQHPDKVKQIQISDMSGKILFSKKTARKKQRLNIGKFPKGAYFLKITTAGKDFTSKFVKN